MKKKSRKETARDRDLQRILESRLRLESDPHLFIGRIDPKLRKTAADGVGAIAELTGQSPTDVMQKLSPPSKKRGRKQAAETPARILLVAKLFEEGLTQGKMAPKVFQGLPKDVAYHRMRSFIQKNKAAISSARTELKAN